MAKKVIVVLYCVVSVLFILNSKVNSQDLAWKTLIETSSFECKFPAGKSAVITEVGKPIEFNKDGTPIPSKGKWTLHKEVDNKFPSLTFRKINRGENTFLTAEMSGNTGNISQVEGFLGPGLMTFIEMMPLGSISITTIFAEFDSDQELVAIHSRHVLGFSNVVASQYYGSCRPIFSP